jgi:hypothetical protein
LCATDGECGATFNKQGFIVSNGFVSKLNAAGDVLVYSTFLGGYANDQALAIAVDANESAYVTGQAGAPAGINITPPPVPPAPDISHHRGLLSDGLRRAYRCVSDKDQRLGVYGCAFHLPGWRG